ncbi:WYL domain-containing protein [Bacillus mycoides]|uniref:WYL domain-containing protein n=1 Tax=Bacillus mycoides TaxID=1405 RepID=UPI003D00C56A
MSYCRYGNNQRVIQHLKLLITDGNWYCFSWDLDKNEFRNFRCDYIQSVKYKDKESIPFTEETISSLFRKQFNTQRPFCFKDCILLYSDDNSSSKKIVFSRYLS